MISIKITLKTNVLALFPFFCHYNVAFSLSMFPQISLIQYCHFNFNWFDAILKGTGFHSHSNRNWFFHWKFQVFNGFYFIFGTNSFVKWNVIENPCTLNVFNKFANSFVITNELIQMTRHSNWIFDLMNVPRFAQIWLSSISRHLIWDFVLRTCSMK